MSAAGAGEARASIVVATTRDGARLERCLAALEQGTRDVPYELVLVLSGADEDVRAVARAASSATVVESDVNLGFAGASNLGRRAAHGEAILLVHDDVEVEEGWLAALLAAADRHPGAGVIAPRVVGRDGRIQLAGAVIFRDGTPGLVGQGADPADPYVLAERSVDYCSSCCALVRAGVWDAIGGMDEHFFPAGYADADLAFAVRRAGWDVRVEPSAVVRHSGGSTLPPGFKQWVHARNGALFRERWRTELADHEPLGEGGAEAVARALERASHRARTLSPAAAAPSVRASERRIDPATLPALEVSLMREYVAERDAERESLEAELRRVGAELAALHAHAGNEIRARQARIEELDAMLEALRARPHAR